MTFNIPTPLHINAAGTVQVWNLETDPAEAGAGDEGGKDEGIGTGPTVMRPLLSCKAEEAFPNDSTIEDKDLLASKTLSNTEGKPRLQPLARTWNGGLGSGQQSPVGKENSFFQGSFPSALAPFFDVTPADEKQTREEASLHPKNAFFEDAGGGLQPGVYNAFGQLSSAEEVQGHGNDVIHHNLQQHQQKKQQQGQLLGSPSPVLPLRPHTSSEHTHSSMMDAGSSVLEAAATGSPGTMSNPDKRLIWPQVKDSPIVSRCSQKSLGGSPKKTPSGTRRLVSKISRGSLGGVSGWESPNYVDVPHLMPRLSSSLKMKRAKSGTTLDDDGSDSDQLDLSKPSIGIDLSGVGKEFNSLIDFFSSSIENSTQKPGAASNTGGPPIVVKFHPARVNTETEKGSGILEQGSHDMIDYLPPSRSRRLSAPHSAFVPPSKNRKNSSKLIHQSVPTLQQVAQDHRESASKRGDCIEKVAGSKNISTQAAAIETGGVRQQRLGARSSSAAAAGATGSSGGVLQKGRAPARSLHGVPRPVSSDQPTLLQPDALRKIPTLTEAILGPPSQLQTNARESRRAQSLLKQRKKCQDHLLAANSSSSSPIIPHKSKHRLKVDEDHNAKSSTAPSPLDLKNTDDMFYEISSQLASLKGPGERPIKSKFVDEEALAEWTRRN